MLLLICSGSGGCNQLFSGTSRGSVNPSHQAIADIIIRLINSPLVSATKCSETSNYFYEFISGTYDINLEKIWLTVPNAINKNT